VAEPAPAAPARGTPLPLRSSHPINLIPAERHTGTGGLFLALFVGAAIGLGYWLRRQQAPAPNVGPELKILVRSPVGVRSDLLVVDVGGQRLLLGVTPSSIQHIAVLDHATGLATETEEPANDSANEEVRSRFVAMIDAARQPVPAPEAEASAARTAERPHRVASHRRQSPARHEVEEQARGLLELGNLA
jgi:flagellar protein FliO/FliZ